MEPKDEHRRTLDNLVEYDESADNIHKLLYIICADVRQLKQDMRAVHDLVELYASSKVLGRILLWVALVLGGLATVWSVLWPRGK